MGMRRRDDAVRSGNVARRAVMSLEEIRNTNTLCPTSRSREETGSGKKMVYSSNASLHGLRLRQGISASLAIPTYAPLHPELAHILLSVCRSISSGVTRFVFLTNFHTKMLNRYTTMPI